MNETVGLKKYIDIYSPTERCNFTCSYCYVSQEGNASGEIVPIGHTPMEVRKALPRKRLGGVCLLNLSALTKEEYEDIWSCFDSEMF